MNPVLPGLAAMARATAPPRPARRATVASLADAARRRARGRPVPPPNADFEVVLRAARAGYPWARERLYGAYVADLAAYARGHGAPDPAASANAVLLGVLRRIERFRGDEAAFETWLYTVARNGLTVERQRHLSRRRRRARLRVERARDLGVRDAARLLPALPPELRDVVLLRGVGDLETDQIATILGIDLAKAMRLRRRAAVAMLDLLDERSGTGRASGLASVQQRLSAAGLMGEVPRPSPELRALFDPEPPCDTPVEIALDDGGRFARRVATLGAATVATALISLTVGGPLGVLPVSRVSAATVADHAGRDAVWP